MSLSPSRENTMSVRGRGMLLADGLDTSGERGWREGETDRVGEGVEKSWGSEGMLEMMTVRALRATTDTNEREMREGNRREKEGKEGAGKESFLEFRGSQVATGTGGEKERGSPKEEKKKRTGVGAEGERRTLTYLESRGSKFCSRC